MSHLHARHLSASKTALYRFVRVNVIMLKSKNKENDRNLCNTNSNGSEKLKSQQPRVVAKRRKWKKCLPPRDRIAPLSNAHGLKNTICFIDHQLSIKFDREFRNKFISMKASDGREGSNSKVQVIKLIRRRRRSSCLLGIRPSELLRLFDLNFFLLL